MVPVLTPAFQRSHSGTADLLTRQRGNRVLTVPLRLQLHFEVIPQRGRLAEDELFIVARDKYPISPGHNLIIVKRIVARFRELTSGEKARLLQWVDWCIEHLQQTLKPPQTNADKSRDSSAAAGFQRPPGHPGNIS